MSLDELKQAIGRLESAEDSVALIAYNGYCSGSGSFVSPPTSKHGMVEGGIEVKNQRMYRELENLKREAAVKANEINEIADRYKQLVWSRSPEEPITEEQLEGLERYEKKRRRVKGA